MTEDLHNFFFYANACHVCKSSGNESVLKKCGKCKMISYCGKDHQKQHWQQHRDLCQVLSDILGSSSQSNLLEDLKNSDMKDWVKAKMNLMLLVSLKLGRKLLPYEEEMFKFPKACVTCHNTNSKELIDCQSCSSASFCYNHQYDPAHTEVCSLFSLCFELDIASVVFLRNTPRIAVPFHTETAYLPTTMKSFIDLYINEDKSLPVSNKIRISHISEYLTRPLSLLYSIEKLEYTPKSTLNIHIIGANLIEWNGIEIWEILLHWIPLLTNLNLKLIGPEFDSNNKNSESIVCDCCNEKNMKLRQEQIGILYHEYVQTENFVKPDLIIGYNLGIHECENVDSPDDKWAPTLHVLSQQNCPFILTAYTESEAENDHKRLCQVLNTPVHYLLFEKNPFSSLRPHRDYESEKVYYQNQYIIIYANLNRNT